MGNFDRMAALEGWLRWCLENCDDSPEWNFGTDATDKIRALLRGEDIAPPNTACTGRDLYVP